MSRVKLGELVSVRNEREDHPAESRYDRFVGLEHYDTGAVKITRWGSTDMLVSSMKVFHRGDILVARRNVYLRRASYVDFDGLTSGDSIILQTKDDSNLMFLPFVLNTDDFWDYADQHADGTMSKRLAPVTLLEYEFEMPDPVVKATLSETLWTIERTKDAYKALIEKSDELVKSQFIEMFGDPVDNEKDLPVYRFSDVASSRLGKMLDKGKQTGKYQKKYLANANVQWFSFDLENLNMMDFNEKDQKEFSLQNGDLLVCEGGEIGRCAIWHGELQDCYFQKAIHRVRCNRELILPEYLGYSFYIHSQKNGFSDIVSSKSTIAHLPGDKLKAMNIIVPPLEQQRQFSGLLEQIDKSKLAAKQALESLKAMQKSLMRKYLG